MILCYASYLRSNDDVALTSLTASSTNEFCEVVLGGLIIVPAAFLFLGPGNTPDSTFSLGFFIVPAIMDAMPAGSFFGGMWFGLLFLAAVTSSISMLQPAIAFLENGFGLGRRTSVTLLGIVTLLGAAVIMWFSENVQALDYTDFWCEFMMILAGLGQVIIFGWIIGAKKGLKEANRGADFQIPPFIGTMIRFVTPAFLVTVLALWLTYNAGARIDGMNSELQGSIAARKVYQQAIAERSEFTSMDSDSLESKTTELLGISEGVPASLDGLPNWLRAVDENAEQQSDLAKRRANIAKYVFIAIILIFILILVLGDIACRGRIKRTIEQFRSSEADLGAEI